MIFSAYFVRKPVTAIVHMTGLLDNKIDFDLIHRKTQSLISQQVAHVHTRTHVDTPWNFVLLPWISVGDVALMNPVSINVSLTQSLHLQSLAFKRTNSYLYTRSDRDFSPFPSIHVFHLCDLTSGDSTSHTFFTSSNHVS